MTEGAGDLPSQPGLPSADVPGDEHIILIPSFLARPGAGAELERHLLHLAAVSSQEEGCVEYTVHLDVNDPDRFVLYERWTTQEALDRHDRTEHVAAFVVALPSLVAEPMQRWELRRRTAPAS